MLDAKTKQKIDSARDILVGKVADPKAQVDQITNALIYKFMDDMDKKAQDLGGKATFFIDDFEKYSWTKLLDKRLSGYERIDLYVQAITGMSRNPHIPQLFRNIFKDAVLAYRDPETLSLFLKEIDEFSYDHSENLGDAFEYLLSVLGSQGDAGQFRTPRHIIDFIVNVVDPKKNETILDPACGTAGFLISAYKHILRQNDGKNNKTGSPMSEEKPLSPSEKLDIMKNFAGYDITPDMVKLSLVNMYLHGFADPHIFEYDTLTSEDHWNEHATVILANPPFMTPKGGIRPHKRFSIQSKRAEVLFVDYITEHLTPSGRAGVVVPEGIIFKNQRAYNQLRKILVEEYLVAIVSLPAGVFKPYSGAKTSILILDKLLSKKSEYIAFFKVENDGFQLGDKRLPIEQNDLPQVQDKLVEYLHLLRLEKSLEDFQPIVGLIVDKEEIAERGHYNLIGETYRKAELKKHQEWPMVPIGKICKLIGGGTPSKQNNSYWTNGSIKWISSKHINKRGRITDYELISQKAIDETSTKIAPKSSTIIITRVSVGKFAFADDEYAINQDITALVSQDTELLSPEFIYALAPNIARVVERNARGTSVRGVTRSFLSKQKIPLPPLEIQKEIVGQIRVKQNAIDHAEEIVKNLERERRYFGQEVKRLKDVKWVKLGEVAEIISGQSPPGSSYNNAGVGIPFYQGKAEFRSLFIGEPTKWTTDPRKFADKGDIVISVRAPVGPVNLVTQPICIGRGLTAIRPVEERLLTNFAFYILNSMQVEIVGNAGTTVTSINRDDIKKIKIPLPSIGIQKQLIAEAEKEEKIIESNRHLIRLMEEKIDQTLTEVVQYGVFQ